MTPIRRQYLDIKRRFPTAIVFFRLGDFYETFDDDAALCARELGLTLTSRPLGKDLRVPMAGIPHHAAEGYLARLIARGYRVAVAEQTSDPALPGLVERQVTRIVTPGTVLTDNLLPGPSANYLAAVVPSGEMAGYAYLELASAEFVTGQLPLAEVAAELARLQPAELLTPEGVPPLGYESATLATADPRMLDPEEADRALREHFGVHTLAGFGCAGLPLAVSAAAAVVQYVRETQPLASAHIDALRTFDPGDSVLLDAATRRNLELFASRKDRGKDTSLAGAIDRTRTPMGMRLLRARLGQPLRDPARIATRLEQVDHFVRDGLLRGDVRASLGAVPDLDRLLTRVASGAAGPRDLVNLRRGLTTAREIGERLGPGEMLPRLPRCDDVVALLCAAIADEVPASLDQRDVIRSGYDAELDAVRSLTRDARAVLACLEKSERGRTGIRTLKIGYTRVSGYYIEVPLSHQGAVPETYQRRQTLAGAQRYVTPELKEYEERLLSADEDLTRIESALFTRVCAEVARHAPAIRRTATTLAEIDVAAGLAEMAVERDYCLPTIDDSGDIRITAGRHAVVEATLPPGAFVPNDTELSSEAQIVVLTGPNMAGKSTYLRQVAQIVLLAQAGCPVPARAAHIGVADRVFTRIGAQDDLAGGNSTFMVEMSETAAILHHATPRSLVILDEVGRGTSTYDGLSIARAVVEYLHNQRERAARTLFATHYHELTELAQSLPRVRNATVAVSEQDGEVVFLRRIIPGGADRSYGLHVAQLAGLPRAVIVRAAELLEELERDRESSTAKGGAGAARRRDAPPVEQLMLFGAPDPLVAELAGLDVDSMTPLDALTQLYTLRRRARGDG